MSETAASSARQIDPKTLIDDFSRDGFVAVRPLFEADQMRRLNAELARFIRDVVPTMPDAQVYYEDTSDKSSLKQLQRMFQYDPYFRELMDNSIVRQIAETVLQDEVVPVNMQYFNKPPGIGQATPPIRTATTSICRPARRSPGGSLWRMWMPAMAASTTCAARTMGRIFARTVPPACWGSRRA